MVYTLEEIKKIITPIAMQYHISSIYVFGSYSRGEATEDSDVDLLIDLEGSDVHGLWGMSRLRDDLSHALGKEVDIVTLRTLNQKSTQQNSPLFIENVQTEMRTLYA